MPLLRALPLDLRLLDAEALRFVAPEAFRLVARALLERPLLEREPEALALEPLAFERFEFARFDLDRAFELVAWAILVPSVEYGGRATNYPAVPPR